jgi:uncharacterized membrane protein
MRIVLTTLLLCAAVGVAQAETVEVTGVAFDDVLNLRAEPRAGAALVGALPPTAFGIEALKRADGWVHVRSGKLEGWAAARYLRPQLEPGERPPSPLQCVGTEPFWSFTLDGNSLSYSTPDMKPVAAQVGSVQRSRNSTIVWRVAPKDGPVASTTIEARQACSDGMSDRVFSFSARVETRDGMLLSGCCDAVR